MNMVKTLVAVAVVVSACGCASERIPGRGESCGPAMLKVAVYADRGPGGIGAAEWYRIVNDSPDMELKLVDGAAVRNGALKGQDLLIMPGGSSTNEYNSLGLEGVERMKDFIREGGGYIGTCAGCCLLMDGPGRARVMPWNTLGAEPDLFYPQVKVNEAGAKALGIAAGNHTMRYHGGPLMRMTTNTIEGASFELWGTVNSECSYSGKISQKKRMYGAAAILGGTYGKGRVFVTSMHPEYYESMHYFVVAAIRWVTGREVTIRRPQRRRGDLSVGYVMGRPTNMKAAETMLAVAALDGVDFQALNGDDAFIDRFAHLDVLVSPYGFSNDKKSKVMYDAACRFVARGGVLLTCAPKATPEGGRVCPDGAALVEAVRDLAR